MDIGVPVTVACNITLAIVAWALWVRRGTWRIPWESPTTGAILLLGVGVALIAPQAESNIGKMLYEITGLWHVNNMIGFFCLQAALASSTLAGMLRMPSMRNRIAPMLHWPFAISVALIVALFCHSKGSNTPEKLLPHISHYPWIIACFAVHVTALLYFGTLNAWVAVSHLRDDPRAKPVAIAWLVGLAIGALSIVGLGILISGHAPWYDGGLLATCICTVVFSISSSRSWQRKLTPWRNLLVATGARWFTGRPDKIRS
ncbi:hypothetical protein [Mycobacterium colombiense]|uniref:hypothetical protein n=1 Tax=Mycobacterium colombiense TaxID=339268 RepID=UPI0012DAFAFF|nr:hypothetical protein [Mycobacterium colombiense]